MYDKMQCTPAPSNISWTPRHMTILFLFMTLFSLFSSGHCGPHCWTGSDCPHSSGGYCSWFYLLLKVISKMRGIENKKRQNHSLVYVESRIRSVSSTTALVCILSSFCQAYRYSLEKNLKTLLRINSI